MIAGSELFILDVGHGNTAFLSSEGHTAIFDTAPGTELLELLNTHSISEIEHVFISHADKDHVGGLLTLLTELTVKNLYINADPRDTDNWNDLRVAVNDSVRRNNLRKIDLQSSLSGISIGDMSVEIFAPSAGLAMGGVGSKDHEYGNEPINANSLSAVLGLMFQGQRIVLFTGDMDENSFGRIQSDNSSLSANILVFPHHGGRGAGNLEAFAHKIIDLVQPNLTLFSIGRNQHGTPQPEIISGIRKSMHKTHVLCTQLSAHCAVTAPSQQFMNLLDLPSRGRSKMQTCGGSVHVRLDDLNTCYEWLTSHAEYVQNHLPTPLCLRQ